MYKIKSLLLKPCTRCILSQHKSNLGSASVFSLVRDGVYNVVRTSNSIFSTRTRCHSTEQAPYAGYYASSHSDSSIRENPDPSESISASDKEPPKSDKDKLDKHQRRHRRAKRKRAQGVNDWDMPEGLDSGIVIYNSLSRSKEPLILPHGRTLSWYQCGPTVYDHAHIGHASSYIRVDMIRRVMKRMFNIDIVQVMGVTDIDDKIIKRAKELRYPDFLQLARMHEASFFRDLDSLRVLRPTVTTRVTEHIPDIIRFIQQIITNGYAYSTPSGSVYFSVADYKRYGRLKRRADDDFSQKVDKEKRNVHDFALWKAAKPDEPFWESPFGKGRPGWHIECSTMAGAVFGPTLDIHSGGEDLRFPHHENELAQSEACFCNKQWTNYWIHTGSLHRKKEEDKMSKSLKNTISVRELLSKFTPNQFRVFCMMRPYQMGLEYSDDTMQRAAAIYSGWSSFLTKAESYVQGQLQSRAIDEQLVYERLHNVTMNVERALKDDFNFPEVVRQLEELVDATNVELNRQPHTAHQVLAPRSTGTIASVLTYMERTLEMLGIDVTRRKSVSETGSTSFTVVMDSLMKFRKEVREFARSQPQFDDAEIPDNAKDARDLRKKEMLPLLKACDEVRDNLSASAGIKINDHNKGSSWNVVESVITPPTSKRKC